MIFFFYVDRKLSSKLLSDRKEKVETVLSLRYKFLYIYISHLK